MSFLFNTVIFHRGGLGDGTVSLVLILVKVVFLCLKAGWRHGRAELSSVGGSALALLLFVLNVSSSFSIKTRRTGAIFIGVPSSLYPLLSSIGQTSYVSFVRDGVGTRIAGHFKNGSRVARLDPSCISVRVSSTDG